MELPTQAQIQEFKKRIQTDPVWFVNNVLMRPTWEKEVEILEAIRDYDEVSVRSCNGSGKTYTAGSLVHWWLVANYEDDPVVVTTAPTFRQVKELLWREIRSAVVKGLYPDNVVLDTLINLSDKCFAIGLSADKPDQFQGFHSKKLLAIIDEASGVAEEIFQAIDGLNPYRTLLLGNPMQNTGRFAESFKQEGVKKIQISAFDTPNIKAGQVVIPGLIQQKDIERIRLKYGEDSDVYRVRVLGEFPKADVDTLISVDEVARAITREVKVLPQWENKMGVDPARFGNDLTAIVIRKMGKVIRKETFSNQDTMQTTGHILRIAKEEHVLPQNINIDVIGLGAGIVDRAREIGWRVNGVNVANKAKDEEHYLNLRAELYGDKVKEWIATGDLLDDDDFYELSNIKYKFNSKGQLQIESKEDMKKRGIPSPNVADALMLTFASPKVSATKYEQSQPITPMYGDRDVPF